MVVHVTEDGRELIVFNANYVAMLRGDTLVFVELKDGELRVRIPEDVKVITQTFEDEEEDE